MEQRPPVVLVGLPRTGSTVLHRLLALHPALRAPCLWELLSPVAPPGAVGAGDPVAEAERYVADLHRTAPELARVHPTGAYEPEECEHLMNADFRNSVLGLLSYRVPSYASWLLAQDLTSAYELHRAQLAHVLARRPAPAGARLVLKSPSHLWHLPSLDRVYPGARFVVLERDVEEAIGSVCGLVVAARRRRSAGVDPVEIGREMTRRHAHRSREAVRVHRRPVGRRPVSAGPLHGSGGRSGGDHGPRSGLAGAPRRPGRARALARAPRAPPPSPAPPPPRGLRPARGRSTVRTADHGGVVMTGPSPHRDRLPYPFDREHCLSPLPHTGLLAEPGLARITLPSGDPAHLAVRHADVVRVLTDRRLSRRAMLSTPGGPRWTLADLEEPSLLGLDPPDHTRVRRLCAPAFRHDGVDGLAGAVDRHVGRLLDGLLAAGAGRAPVDLLATVALPLAEAVLFDVLGVSSVQRAPLARWARRKLSLTALPPEQARAGHLALRAHYEGLFFPARGGDALVPGGLFHRLRDAHLGGGLSRPELLATAVNLFVAGHATTAATLTNGVLALLNHPDQWQALRRDRRLLGPAVEEILRFDTIADVGLPRLAVADVTVGATLVRAGEAVVPSHAHAGRDPAVFDRPDSFDITRPPGPHLAFGHGPHHCIGAGLARLELRTAIGALAGRVPALRLAEPATALPFPGGSLIGGVSRLPVYTDAP
ncbi:hypothetical protein GCM10019017_21230 [Streptomyces showdoensis]